LKHESRFLLIVALVVLTFAGLSVESEGAILQDEGVRFDPVTIDAYLNANGTTMMTFKALAWNEGISPISSIAIRIDSVNVALRSATANDIARPASLGILERYSIVSMELSNSLSSGENIWLEVHLSMTDLQSESGIPFDQDSFLSDFIYYVRPLSTYSNFTLTVLLPPTSVLSQQSVTPIFPQSSGNYTDGLSLAFVWQVDTLQPGQEKAFIVRYQTSIEASLPNTLTGLQLAFVALAFLGIGLVAGYIGPRIIARLKEISRVRIVGITSEEEEVLDAIRLKGGSCPQKDLYHDLDMSQAKVSLILTALEERGLVRRFKDGRENTVHIIEE